MAVVKSLQRILAIAEQKRGPDAPGVKALRRQLEEITRAKQSPTASEPIVSWSAGLRGKSKSESPNLKRFNAAEEPPRQPSTEE